MRLLCLALLLWQAHSFLLEKPVDGLTSSTRLWESVPVSTGFDTERLKNLVDVPKGESQRQLRRTVYSHDDWKKHRNQDRFLVYLAATAKSGVYKNLAGEVIVATTIAALVCFYNVLFVDGLVDFSGIQYAPLGNDLSPVQMPLSVFTLTSPSLGLLLGK